MNKALLDNSKKDLPINLNEAYLIYDKSEFAQNLLGSDVHHNFGILYNYEYSVIILINLINIDIYKGVLHMRI